MTITIVGNGRFGNYLRTQIQLHTGITPQMLLENCDPTAYAAADLTILCVPIREIESCLKNVIPNLRENSVLMDTCSVKEYPLELMEKTCKDLDRTDLKIVGSHPLFGPQSAPTSCSGQRVSLCPTEGNQIPPFIRDWWGTEMKTVVIQTSAQEHDRQMATQVLNHFIGRATAATEVERVPLSTRTHDLFMDIQDIVCGNSEELFEDMNRFNPQAKKIRERFLQEANAIHKTLCDLEDTKAVKFYPVIHVDTNDESLAFKNAEIAARNGCTGVMFISMTGDDKIIPDLAREIKEKFPQLRVGINLLQTKPEQALKISIDHELDATWEDEQITGTKSPATEEEFESIKNLLKTNPNHEFFVGVAFKYQTTEKNPGAAANKALELGYIPTTSGDGTGKAASQQKLTKIREEIGNKSPLAIASGVTPENIHEHAKTVTHVLVATGIEKSHFEIDEEKLKKLLKNA